MHAILINGEWRSSESSGMFHATNPHSATALSDEYPVSSWADCDAALSSAASAFERLREQPPEKVAEFLERYAERIENRADEICDLAYQETGLPIQPRLLDVELPRTCNQLRQAAAAARDAIWSVPTIDTQTGLRSIHAPLGPVAVFGPNNFPFAFGSVSGGDFAAAIAAGNPVIAKANSCHPGTTRLLAEEAQFAVREAKLPEGSVQLIYRMEHADGLRLVTDPRLAAVGYTGSRAAGLRLKSAADSVGKPIYLELSSINPVFMLPGAIAERGEAIVDQLVNSCLMGTGQFCTSPGMVVLWDSPESETFIQDLVDRMSAASEGVLLSRSVLDSLIESVNQIADAGGKILCGGCRSDQNGFRYANTVLKTDGQTYLQAPESFQREAFGNALLLVIVRDDPQAIELVQTLEGNLTGTIYSHSDARAGQDEAVYGRIEPYLRQRVGRLLNDKMPTGVAVSPAMNHGGPFPATGHPGFTAVGMPTSIIRFSMLQSFDNVRPHRLPLNLQDENPHGVLRLVDGQWTSESLIVPAG